MSQAHFCVEFENSADTDDKIFNMDTFIVEYAPKPVREQTVKEKTRYQPEMEDVSDM